MEDPRKRLHGASQEALAAFERQQAESARAMARVAAHPARVQRAIFVFLYLPLIGLGALLVWWAYDTLGPAAILAFLFLAFSCSLRLYKNSNAGRG